MVAEMKVQEGKKRRDELDTAVTANEAVTAPSGLVIGADGATLKKARRSRI